MNDNELKAASKQVMDEIFRKVEVVQKKFDLGKADAMLSVVVDQLAVLIVLEQERQHREAAAAIS